LKFGGDRQELSCLCRTILNLCWANTLRRRIAAATAMAMQQSPDRSSTLSRVIADPAHNW